MKTIGIDIGTTTVSAVVLDTVSRKVVTARTIANGSFIKTGREWERIQDAAALMQKAKGVLDELLDDFDDVRSIGITGQMHGIVYVDRDGQAVSPLYTWQDGRGNLPVFHGETLTEVIAEKYHMAVSSGFGLVTHLYNVKTGQVPEGSASFCTVGDYLGMLLTGRKKPLVHASNAASMGFYDSRREAGPSGTRHDSRNSKGRFQVEVLQAEGVDLQMLPDVTDDCQVLGTYRGIPVTVGLGDNQASFLGSVGLAEETVLLNMGTGGQISVLSDRHFEAPGIEARPFIKGRYLLVGSSLCGGRAYAILEKFLRACVVAAGGEDREQYDTMLRLARAGEKTPNGLQVVTAFNGTRVDPALRGSISNISEENFNPESMVYGTLTGMAQELYDMYRVIQEGTGITAKHLVASGNGLRKNPVLQQIFAQMFNAGLTMAPYKEEAACGAAVSALQFEI